MSEDGEKALAAPDAEQPHPQAFRVVTTGSRVAWHLLPLSLFVFFALLETWPLARRFSSQVVGIPGDAFQTVWHFWLVSQWLETGSSPLWTRYIFWPTGTSLWIHVSNVLNALAVWPVLRGAGPVAAYNAAALGNLVLSAFGAYLLAWRLLANRSAAILAGLAFGFCAYFSAHLLGHLILLTAGFIPLGAVWLIEAVETGRIRPMLLFALAVAVNLATLIHALFLAIFFGIMFAWLSLRARRRRNELVTVWRRMLSAGFVGLLLATPILVGLRSEIEATRGVTVPIEVQRLYSADLLSWLTPNPFHPLLGPLAKPWILAQTDSRPVLAEALVFPGFTVLLLAVVAIWPRRLRSRAAQSHGPFALGALFWATLAATCFVLSLGPELRVGGAYTHLALPFAALAHWPGFRTLSAPSRFAVLGQLAVAMLAAGGLTRLTAAQSPWRARALAGVAIALVAFECLWLPYPVAVLPPASPFHEWLRGHGSGESILDVPFRTYDPLPMIDQMTHGRPILNGYVSRFPSDCVACQFPAPLSRLRLAEPVPDILPPFDLGRDGAAVLRSFDVGHVLIHRNRLDEPRLTRLRGAVRAMGLGPPVYEDSKLEAYAVPRATDTMPRVTTALVLGINLDPGGWSRVGELPDGTPYRSIVPREAGAEILFWATGAATARLRLTAWKTGPGKILRLTLNGEDRVDKRIGRAPETLELQLPLRRGSNTLRFRGGMTIGPLALDLGPP